MESPDLIVQTAEEKLREAEQQLARTEEALEELENQLAALEDDVRDIADVRESSWPSFRSGMAPPLALLAAGFFFDTGVWPLGLLATVLVTTQVLLLPRLNRRRS